jgi:hypothetical protein
MHSLLKDFPFAGLIDPEQIYILFDSDDGTELSIETEYLYTIRNEQELIDGLTLEIESLANFDCKALDFLGVQRISDDCYEFTLRVLNTDNNREELHQKYLRRILTAKEGIKKLKEA